MAVIRPCDTGSDCVPNTSLFCLVYDAHFYVHSPHVCHAFTYFPFLCLPFLVLHSTVDSLNTNTSRVFISQFQ